MSGSRSSSLRSRTVSASSPTAAAEETSCARGLVRRPASGGDSPTRFRPRRAADHEELARGVFAHATRRREDAARAERGGCLGEEDGCALRETGARARSVPATARATGRARARDLADRDTQDTPLTRLQSSERPASVPSPMRSIMSPSRTCAPSARRGCGPKRFRSAASRAASRGSFSRARATPRFCSAAR